MSFFNKIKKIGNEVFELGKLKKDIESKKWNLITKLRNYENKEEYPEFLQKELDEIADLEEKLKEVSENFKESGKQLFNKDEKTVESQSNNKKTTNNDNEGDNKEIVEETKDKEVPKETINNEETLTKEEGNNDKETINEEEKKEVK